MAKHIGLPKVDRKHREYEKNKNKSNYKRKKSTNHQKKNEFILLNSTRVKKVKEYFESFCPGLYEGIFEKEDYYLYINNNKGKNVFIVPREIHLLVKTLRKQVPIEHCAINFGFFKIKRDKNGLDERFYLSYEGGRFTYYYSKSQLFKYFSQLDIVKLNTKGEKAFMYGRNIDLRDALSKTDKLRKRRLIFVLNSKEQYIGLALLKVELIGSEQYEKKSKYIEKFSRSDNFMLTLLNLADPGYYIRNAY